MGNNKSNPETSQSDDADLTIINNQDVHTEFHLGQEQKWWIIIIIVLLQLVVTIHKLVAKMERRKAIRRMAMSMANLSEVVVNNPRACDEK